MCRRRLKIKKLIFSAALIISTLLLTCTLFEPDDELYSGGGSRNADNNYSLTVYLDGYTPPSSSRSLTRELAMFGADLFEIAFYRNDGTNTTVARGAWERGHTAGVSGVARNVDYGYVSTAAVDGNGARGAAILFVGKRSDKTLLGVGRLVGVDNGDGDGTIASTTVTDETVSVTFEVSALKAGASRSANKSASSFFTPNNAGTSIIEVYIGSRIFPLYNINRNQTITGNYTLGVTTAAPYDFAYFNAGILRGGPATLIQNDALQYPIYGEGNKLQPRYPWGNGDHGLPTSFSPDINTPGYTTIALANNQSGTTVLTSPVQFTFNTTGTPNSVIFSFAFQIPVYPLTNADNRGNGNFWYIRPGYDSYIRDLDDGIGGTGGAILIGVGDIDQSLIFGFFVGTPFKTRYYRTTSLTDPPTPPGPQNPPAADDYKFDLTGLELAIRSGGIPMKGISIDAATYILGGPGGVVVTPDQNLFDIIFLTNGSGTPIYDSNGRIQFRPAFDPNIPGSFNSNDMIRVRVEYFDPDTQAVGDPPYDGYFSIYLSDPGTLGPIPPSSEIPTFTRYVITNYLDLLDALGDIQGSPGGTYIFVFYDSFDLPQFVLSNGPYLIIIIAGNPNVVLGKANANGGFENWGNGNTFYYGIWPYNDTELVIGGSAVTSQPFRINAAGSYANIDSGVRQYNTWFMSSPNYYLGYSIIVNTGAVDVVWPQNFTQVNTAAPP